MTAPNQPSSSPVETATPAETSTATTDNASPDVNIGQPDIHAPGQAPGGDYPTGPNIVAVRPRLGDGPPPGQANDPIQELSAPVDEVEPDAAPNIVFVGDELAASDGAGPTRAPAEGGDGEDAPNVVSVSTDNQTPPRDAGDGPPPQSARKQDWVDYARTRGASDDDLDGATKDDLIDTYGPKES